MKKFQIVVSPIISKETRWLKDQKWRKVFQVKKSMHYLVSMIFFNEDFKFLFVSVLHFGTIYLCWKDLDVLVGWYLLQKIRVDQIVEKIGNIFIKRHLKLIKYSVWTRWTDVYFVLLFLLPSSLKYNIHLQTCNCFWHSLVQNLIQVLCNKKAIYLSY